MKKKKGIRPQDIVILLKLVVCSGKDKRIIDLATELFLSTSEVSESLYRSHFSGLVDGSKRIVHKKALLEFLLFGIKYVFPERPGAIVRGIPTAHSAPPLNIQVISDQIDTFVWEDVDGLDRGQQIEPLYFTVPKAVKLDDKLYELLALVDTLRVGRPREVSIAKQMLTERLLNE